MDKFDRPWYPMVKDEDELDLESPSTGDAQTPTGPFTLAAIGPQGPLDDEKNAPDNDEEKRRRPGIAPERLLVKYLDNDQFWSLAAEVLDDPENSSPLGPTGEYLPIPLTTSWVTFCKKETILPRFFQQCADRLRRNGWKPNRAKYLPRPASYQKMIHGMCGSGFVVRLGNPSDFHMIFEETAVIDQMLNNEEWGRFFWKDKKGKYLFQTSLQLFHGMATLLVEYLRFLEVHLQLGPPLDKEIEYQVGDLVVVKISRGERTYHGGHTYASKFNDAVASGYRGMVKELVWAVDKTKMNKKCFLVHLLDTGEEVVATGSHLSPLPRAFTGFPPMAVKCSLHGISPIGPEWSSSATTRMRELVTPKLERKLFAEFLNKTRGQLQVEESQPSGSTSTLLDEITSAPPFNVELRFISNPDPKSSSSPTHGSPPSSPINISVKLIEEHLGLEWALIPFRRHLRQPPGDPLSSPLTLTPEQEHDQGAAALKESSSSSGENKMDYSPPKVTTSEDPTTPLLSISRDEALHISEGPPYPVTTLDMEQLDNEVRRLFANDPHLEAQIITGEGNEISMKISDEENNLKKECIPSAFRPL